MKNIFNIVKIDFRNISRNKAALIVIAAVAFLPSLYAWLNILASWDPYSNTKGVNVAVVSEDLGTEVQGQKFNVGDEVIVSLTKNDNLGWQFVPKEDAIKGVRHGDYYAAIIIPEDFSEKLSSVTTEEITKPQLEYYINEKINAISPKVAKSGASAVMENIQSSFVEETNKTVLEIFNSLGLELENNMGNIDKLRDTIYQLEAGMPEIYAQLQLADQGLDLAEKSIDRVGDTLDEADVVHSKAKKLNGQLLDRLKESEQAADRAVAGIEENLREAQTVFRNIPQFTSEAAGKGADLDRLISSLEDKQVKLDDTSDRLQTIYDFLKKQDKNLKDSTKIDGVQKSLDENAADLQQLKSNLQSMIQDLERGEHPAVELVQQSQELSDRLSENAGQLQKNYETVVRPQVGKLIEQLTDLSTGMAGRLDQVGKVNGIALEAVKRLNDKRDSIDWSSKKEEIDRMAGQVNNSLNRVETIVKLLEVAGKVTSSDRLASMEEKIKSLQSSLEKTNEILTTIQKAIENGENPSLNLLDDLQQQLESSHSKIEELKKKFGVDGKLALEQAAKRLEDIDKDMRQKYEELQQSKATVDGKLESLLDSAQNPVRTIGALEKVVDRVDRGLSTVDSIQGGLRDIQEFVDSDTISDQVERIKVLQADLQKANASIDDVIGRIEEAKVNGKKRLDDIDHLAERMDRSLEDMITFVSGDFARQYKTVMRDATKALYDVSDVLDDVNAKIPKVQDALQKVAKGVDEGKEKLAMANEIFPEANETVNTLAKKIRRLEEDGDLDKLLHVLNTDPTGVSDFLASPVVLDEHALYPIPNYGSAMNPFYTTLSLWVGALLLVSTLKVDIDEKRLYKSYEIYAGRLITFMGLGMVQALIVTVGNLFIMHTYVVNKLPYVLFGVLISAVFVSIVYTLVSVFGNTGKVLAIILMVMQLGGSGGTFPIQMAPPFFQSIHAFLPFTHAITLLREAIGGIIWEIAWKQILYLFIYFLLALIAGVGLKKFFNKSSDKFMEKAKESKIVI
ncbi:membrane protein [Bacillus sp. OxB-1]|uniref:YhgE/Pip domain-containing protein n=1 Tax=Bacillus sp. (strain OxB-1) TaxID=98228 RepID=UPI000581F08A|nr:YhgE/Pip domain-containing protein [Bacillus sp. OxB-1]BAQ09980.1 membrane protein [Bacillus sp. OxB-1]